MAVNSKEPRYISNKLRYACEGLAANVTSKAFILVFSRLPFVWLKCSVGISKIHLRVIGTGKWNRIMTVSVGYLGIWVSGYLGIWVSGYLGIWVSGYLGIWVSGYLGIWVSGYLGIWVSGYPAQPQKRVVVHVHVAENYKHTCTLYIHVHFHLFSDLHVKCTQSYLV